jgi:hypothetical protein
MLGFIGCVVAGCIAGFVCARRYGPEDAQGGRLGWRLLAVAAGGLLGVTIWASGYLAIWLVRSRWTP